MQGDRSLADVVTIVSAVGSGRSRNEQYQGLRLAKLCWPDLAPRGRKKIRETIAAANFKIGSDRWELAQEVLRLSNEEPEHVQD